MVNKVGSVKEMITILSVFVVKSCGASDSVVCSALNFLNYALELRQTPGKKESAPT